MCRITKDDEIHSILFQTFQKRVLTQDFKKIVYLGVKVADDNRGFSFGEID